MDDLARQVLATIGVYALVFGLLGLMFSTFVKGEDKNDAR